MAWFRRRDESRQTPRELFDDAFMAKLEYLDVVAKKAFAARSRGERRSKKIGSGVEFADHRRYSPGDDFRHIDWNVYARLGKLLVRLYEEEEDLHVYVLVDSSASMVVGDRQKFDHARKLGAALAYIALSSMERASVAPFSAALGQRLLPARGKSQIFRVMSFLKAIEPGGTTAFADSMKSFVHQTKRRGLVVLLSDFYAQDGYEEGLNYLRYNRFEPFVLQLIDPRDAEPSLRGDVTLVDCETGVGRDMTFSARTLAAYRDAYHGFNQELESFCHARRLSHVRASVREPVEDLMLNVFRAGGFVR